MDESWFQKSSSVFTILNKDEKDIWLPVLFDICYENMCYIAPSGLTYEQEKQQWLAEVSPALEKAPRKIVLCFVDETFAGYVQYYTNGNLLMIEEIQIAKAYQRTTLFCSLYKYLVRTLPEDLEIIEAYAMKQNLYSRKLMQKLGMVQIGEDKDFVHLQGSAQKIRHIFQ